MPPEPTMSTRLRASLDHLTIGVTAESADSLTVTHRQGQRPLTGTFDLGPLRTVLGSASSDRHRDLVAAFARGVYQSLTDLPLPEGKFSDLAGRLVPRIERSTFALALDASRRPRPWTQPFVGELVAVYFVELDDGNHMVTDGDFAQWGVTVDRITCAARSLLYYKTQLGETEVYAPTASCEVYRLGDGYDAARALALADLHYHRTRRGMLLALPEPNLLMFQDWPGSQEGVESFSSFARDTWAKSADPLSAQVFTFDEGKIVPVSP